MIANKVREPSQSPCKSCGAVGYELNWIPHVREKLEARGMCHTCDIWEEIIDELTRFVVIDGTVWAPKKDNPEWRAISGGWGLGCGGRMHLIERFDGELIKCNNLWCRGNVPEMFRDRIPDNAKFLRCDLEGNRIDA